MSSDQAYKKGEISTEVETFTLQNAGAELKLDALAEKSKITNGLAVGYFDQGVFWYKIVEGKVITINSGQDDIRYLQKLRIFDENSELLAVKTSAREFYCRLRKDGAGEKCDVLDSTQMLLGTAGYSQDGFTFFAESQGQSGWLPLDAATGGRAAIVTRNYIGYASDVNAGIDDTRFVNIMEVQ